METGPKSNPAESAEVASSKEGLYENDFVEIYHPWEPAIPAAEGLHLVVNPKEISIQGELRAAWYSLGVAKDMAEGRFTEDFWANIQKNAYSGIDFGYNVYGRNPQSKESWAKPVNIRTQEERKTEPLDEKQLNKLQRTMELYLPKWEREAQEVTIFEEGIKEIKPEEDSFRKETEIWQNRPEPWQEKAIWMNDKFVLVIVQKPHLNGLHLVCHARKEYWSKHAQQGVIKAWQTPETEKEDPVFLKGFIESNAILLGVQQLIQADDRFFNSEIHFSGNWGFKPLDPSTPDIGGREVEPTYLTGENLEQARKMEKFDAQKRWASGDPDWHAHGHLYATRDPQEYVKLPSRPAKEVPGEWERTHPLSAKEESDIYNLIQQSLGSWLETNCQGVKIG